MPFPFADARFLRSPQELIFRCRQFLWNRHMRFRPPLITGSAPLEVSEKFLDTFFINRHNRTELGHLLQTTYPTACEAICRDAQQITKGKLTLLGHRLLCLDNGKQWNSTVFTTDPVSKKEVRLDWWQDALSTEVDLKCIWELNRLQFLLPPAIAFLCTADQAYRQFTLRVIEGWLYNNPPYYGVNWGSSLELAYRVISLLWTHQFMDFSPAWPQYPQLLRVLELHGDFVAHNLSIYHSPNTHITGEALGLLYLGLFFYGTEKAEFWLSKGVELLEFFLDKHILADGGYMERSFWYHSYTVEIYFHYYMLSQLFQLNDGRRVHCYLKKAGNFLERFITPDGNIPRFGDDDGGKLMRFTGREVDGSLEEILSCLTCLDKKRLSRPHPVTLFFQQVSLKKSYCSPHECRQITTPFSGYHVINWPSSSGVMQLVFDTGALGWKNCGHGHADALSFVVQRGNNRIVIDPGTYAYKGQKRNVYRTAEAHATLSIDGSFPARPADSPFHWSSRYHCVFLGKDAGLDYKIVAGRLYHNGNQIYHDRTICFFSCGCLVVEDIIVAGRSVQTTRRFPLAGTDWEIISDEICYSNKKNTEITLLPEFSGEMNLEMFHFSRCYGREEDGRLLRIEEGLARKKNCLLTLVNITVDENRYRLQKEGETVMLSEENGSLLCRDLTALLRGWKRGENC